MRTDGFFSFLFFVPRSPTSKICSPFLQFLFLDFGFLGGGDSAMLLCPIGLFVFLGEHLILRRGSRVISSSFSRKSYEGRRVRENSWTCFS